MYTLYAPMSVRPPPNFSWVIPDRLAGSGRPYSHALDAPKQFGIHALVTLTESLPGSPDDLTRIYGETNWIHIPIQDYTAPSPSDFEKLFGFIDRQFAIGHAVNIHCFAGIGRTGTALAAICIREKGMTAKEAIEHIRRIRPGSIETSDQEQSLFRLEFRLLLKGI